MNNKKNKPPPVIKLKLVPPKTSSPRNKSLTRSTKIIKEEDGQAKEYIVLFDELEECGFLGRGQFGTVKKMFHKPSNLTFAVKMINEELMDSNDANRSEIMDLEVSIKIGTGSPFLIKFYGAMHAESYIWILTEVMDTSLDRFYPKLFELKLKMPQIFVSKVAFSVLSALQYMKKLKLMHRDIKPSNILINSTGEIKICDFGISGFMKNSVCTTITGCQYYMPPEKIDTSLAENGYSIKADVWSLGISLIEITTGVHPFIEEKNFHGLMNAIVTEDPPKIDNSKFSSELCNFIDKCLMKSAEKRASCEELLNDVFIQNYLERTNDLLELINHVITELKKTTFK